MKKLKCQVLSDIHLELPLAPSRFRNKYDIQVLSEILILAGDIGIPSKNSLETYLEEVSKKYKLVLYVPGNHEPYRGEYFDTLKRIDTICEKWDNVMFLNKKSVVYSEVRFVGCTLWTNVPEDKRSEVSRGMSDYGKISFGQKKSKMKIEDTLELHREHVEFIQSEIELCKTKKEKGVVVITHHSPNLLNPPHLDHDARECHLCHHGYASDLRDMFQPPIIAWVHGHTHRSNQEVVINGIPCVSNQAGYATQYGRNGFDPNFVLVLDVDVNKEEEEEEHEGEETKV